MRFSASLLATLLLASPAALLAVCGNDNPNGCPSGQTRNNEGQCDGCNPFVPSSGNTQREIEDLDLPGATAGWVPSFSRTFVSRYGYTERNFGTGHNIRHSLQFELAPTSPDSQGRPRLRFTRAKGDWVEFTLTAPGVWTEPATSTQILTQDGAFYTITTAAGLRHRFELSSGTYFLRDITSADGLATTFTYNSWNRVSRVTVPGGRYFQLDYTYLQFVRADGSPGWTYVLTSASTDDGRTVTYTYASRYESTTSDTSVVLKEVTYPGGAKATYTYDFPYPGWQPLLATASDPRVSDTPATRLRYLWCTPSQGPFGAIRQEIHPDTGSVLVERTSPDNQTVIITYANGAERTYTYDTTRPSRNIPSSRDALGREYHFEYTQSGQGLVAAEISPAGYRTEYTRDRQGRVLVETHPGATTTQSTYDALGHLLTSTDELGRVTTHTYDTLGRRIRTDLPDGTYETHVYNALGLPVESRAPDGLLTTRTYAASGLLLSTTRAAGTPLAATTSHTYTAAGRLASTTDPLGRVTTYAYDGAGRLMRVTHPDAAYVTLAYDAYDNLVSTTDELGHVTSRTYDVFRQPLTVTDPLGRTTLYSYDGAIGGPSGCGCGTGNIGGSGKPTKITTPAGRVTELHYDLEWQLISTIEAPFTSLEAVTLYSYDAEGRLSSTRDPLLRVTGYAYDARGRRVSATDPLGRVTTFAYDAAGQLTGTTRADGATATRGYDLLGRLATATDASGNVVTYAYDAAGRLTGLTDSLGHTTAWSYDAAGRLHRKTYADATYEETQYDAAGRPTLHRTPAGVTRACTYDLRGRELSCDWSDATPDVARTYDAAGRLLSLTTAGVVTHTYAYDAAGQLLSETSAPSALAPATFTVAYAYDADGHRSQLTYPDSGTVTYAYDAQGRTAAINAGGATPLASFAYDLAGRRTQKVLENGVSTTYTYDVADQLTALVHRDPAAAELARFAYIYDTGGRRTAKTITGSGTIARSETYGYDSIDQVTSSNYGASGTESFAYDAMGNRSSATLLGVGAVSYAANALNQYTAINAGAPTYDANGNTLTLPDRAFGYDAQSRMKSATVGFPGLPGYHAATFVYDSRNRQVSRTVDGQTTFFVWDGWSLLAEYQVLGGAQTQVARYVHGPRLDEVLRQSRSAAPTPVYLHEDALGSTYLITGSTGSVVERYTYTAFGQVSAYDNTGGVVSMPATRFLYTGREWITELGLNDHRNRFYLPGLGRWLSRDPIEEDGGLNLYGYGGNSPINWIDPLGLQGGRTPGSTAGTGRAPNPWSHPTAPGNTNSNYSPGPEDHWNRNKNNKCPKKEPKDGKCSKGNDWSKDEGNPFHGGLATYRTKEGSQCAYDSNGDLVNSGPYQGTFDYASPQSPLSTLWHGVVDVLPSFIWGNNYTPTPPGNIY